MATDRTPAHKRIARAEKSSAEWKQKATLRREENERLKNRLANIEKTLPYDKELEALKKENEKMSNLLGKANVTISDQQKEFDTYKKNFY